MMKINNVTVPDSFSCDIHVQSTLKGCFLMQRNMFSCFKFLHIKLQNVQRYFYDFPFGAKYINSVNIQKN